MDNNKELNGQEPIADTTSQIESTPLDASAENPSMEELLSEENLKLELPKSGEVKTGVIVRKNEDEILVSIGAKSEGVIPAREISQLSEEELAKLTVGSRITVVVVTAEDQQGNLVLSYTRAQEEADWEQAESLRVSGQIYESEIAGYNKGGLIVKLGQLRGFIPSSQVSLSRRMAFGGNTPDQRWGKMVGQPIIVKVVEVDRERQRLIFSELAVLQESREIFKERLLSEIKVGDELDGRVTSLADFGAFVNINGADGLVHLTEISWDRLKHPSEALKVGQMVRVRVINIDEERKRIGLSIRQLLDDPWPSKVKHLKEGQLVQARIVRLVKFGAFARINGTDIEGLIHISELSDQRVEHPKEVLTEGEDLTLRVVRIEPDQHRVGLSLRKVHSHQYAEMDLQAALSASDEPEMKAETAVEAPEAAVEETPAETAVEAPEAAVDESPAETAVEAPEAAVEETPAETAVEAPEAAVEEIPAETAVEAPQAAVEEIPAETAVEAPKAAVEETPAETAVEEPEASMEESEASEEAPDEDEDDEDGAEDDDDDDDDSEDDDDENEDDENDDDDDGDDEEEKGD